MSAIVMLPANPAVAVMLMSPPALTFPENVAEPVNPCRPFPATMNSPLAFTAEPVTVPSIPFQNFT